MNLKPCPCGKTPNRIGLYGWHPQQKWVMGEPDCCGEWMFEFRASYSKDQDEVERMAVDAWNEMPRAEPKQERYDDEQAELYPELYPAESGRSEK